jgi:hypothetical protein
MEHISVRQMAADDMPVESKTIVFLVSPVAFGRQEPYLERPGRKQTPA